jgi:hypothetical protein
MIAVAPSSNCTCKETGEDHCSKCEVKGFRFDETILFPGEGYLIKEGDRLFYIGELNIELMFIFAPPCISH